MNINNQGVQEMGDQMIILKHRGAILANQMLCSPLGTNRAVPVKVGSSGRLS